MSRKVPLVDMSALHEGLEADLTEAFREVLHSGRYILGPHVAALEKAVAELCGARHAIGVSSGTDALLVSLMVLGVGPGDEVITTPFSFFATAGVIARLNAIPVFADIEPGSCNLDPEELSRVLKERHGGKVKAIVPVHLYGRMARMERINDVAGPVPVVEDAAQSLGASLGKLKAGSCASVGCFSFFPTKNIGCLGDGGMVTTNSEELADRTRILRVHGSKPKYYHKTVGGNFRLDELQAALLLRKWPHLQAWTEKRRANARAYCERFSALDLPVELPELDGGDERCVWNQFVIRTRRREALRGHLQELGIGTEVYYPVPFHLQECFRGLGYRKGDFPQSEQAAAEVLALPVHPGLSEADMDYVVDSIAKFYGGA